MRRVGRGLDGRKELRLVGGGGKDGSTESNRPGTPSFVHGGRGKGSLRFFPGIYFPFSFLFFYPLPYPLTPLLRLYSLLSLPYLPGKHDYVTPFAPLANFHYPLNEPTTKLCTTAYNNHNYDIRVRDHRFRSRTRTKYLFQCRSRLYRIDWNRFRKKKKRKIHPTVSIRINAREFFIEDLSS